MSNILKSLLSSMPGSVAMMDTAGRYILASQEWLNTFHLSEKEIIGQYHCDVFPFKFENWESIKVAVLQGNNYCSDEEKICKDDGSTEYLKCDFRPWLDTDGKVGGIIASMNLITPFKKAKEEWERGKQNKRQALRQQLLTIKEGIHK